MNRLACVLAGLALLLLGPPAAADEVGAGFDCKKASTRIEKAICADAYISFRDGALNALYRKMKAAGIRPAGFQTVLSDWLQRRDGHCGGADKANLTNCLLDSYEKVLARLSRIMQKAGAGPAKEGLKPVAGTYGRTMKNFYGTVSLVEMPDLSVWAEIQTVSGPTHHTCSLWTRSAHRIGSTIVWQDKEEPKCRVTVRVSGKSATIEATRGCRYYCGARGGFTGITYRKGK